MKVTIKHDTAAPPPISGVTLELTFEEATALSVVVRHIAGFGHIREVMDTLGRKLAEVRKDPRNPYTIDRDGGTKGGVIKHSLCLTELR